MEKTVTKFRWFWAWNDDAEAAWLGKMSAQGLHLAKPGLLGFYQFRTGEPKEYAFRLDYHPIPKNNREAYLKIYSDAGWEYIGQMGSWQYFRKDAAKAGPNEIVPDKDSKIGMYRRLILTLCVLYAGMAMFLWTRLAIPKEYFFTGALTWMITVMLVFSTYAIIRLLFKIRQVSKK